MGLLEFLTAINASIGVSGGVDTDGDVTWGSETVLWGSTTVTFNS